MNNTFVGVVAGLVMTAFLGLWFKVAALEANQGPHLVRLQAVAYALHLEVERLTQKGGRYEGTEATAEAVDTDDADVKGQ